VKTQDFDYLLPARLIAQSPTDARQDARMLVVTGAQTKLLDKNFSDFADFCQPGDLLVVNNTRVIPARLQCHKLSGAKVEVMLERLLSNDEFLALARSNKSLKPGVQLHIAGEVVLEFVQREGEFVRFRIINSERDGGVGLFNRYGEVPLPPYIKRAPEQQDQKRYQTVYAKAEGAVAAPTAGLHFNEAMLGKLAAKGIELAQITLHVGAGTFQPVKVDDIAQHKMHQEWMALDQQVVAQIERTKAAGNRVIAVGTTTVRALESAARAEKLVTFNGLTDIFIYPGFQFKVVDVLLTNFHLPKSTLLMMISAFVGIDTIKAAYAHAIEQEYRFFSYGDAMLLAPNKRA
jgi:S-adenosylmethionine:tRNA ribosyltransferase-isomerase